MKTANAEHNLLQGEQNMEEAPETPNVEQAQKDSSLQSAVDAIVMQFAPKLIEAMAVYRLSAADLSAITGLTQAAISQLRTGKREPAYDTLTKIIKAMPVNMRFWFDVA
jgi:DNA-binding Xre family transcriptional regulator